MKQLWIGIIDNKYKCVANTFEETVRYLINEDFLCGSYPIYQTDSNQFIAVRELFGIDWEGSLEKLDYKIFNMLFGNKGEVKNIIIRPIDYIS